MLDDEIQYLGTRMKPRDNPRFPQRNVTGLALHIEKSDGSDPYVLTFERDKSSTIHIGRRPGSEAESRSFDQDKGRAMFRCAVVSRRHAKIALSDSGHVYLIDLNSHHGTHIRKPGETSSRALEPEVPTSLSDGDIITFGKSVGRNEEMVRPIVARFQLLCDGPSPSTIKPLVVPDSNSPMSRASSGRYGLHSPSSSSSDDIYHGQSDSYSDIEEIPPPAPAIIAPPSQSSSESKPESSLNRAFEVLRRLLPPPAAPPVPPMSPLPPSPSVDEFPALATPSSSFSSSSSSPSELPFWYPTSNHCALFTRYPSISDDLLGDPFTTLPQVNPSQDNDFGSSSSGESNHSRSESPMDLASMSPPPAEQQGPSMIGAWPLSVDEPDIADKAVPESDVQAHETREAGDAVVDSAPVPTPLGDKEVQKEAMDMNVYVKKAEYEALYAKYVKLEDELNHLQLQRRKYKAKFNTNVHTVTDKFTELEDRLNDMNAQFTLISERLDSVTTGDVPDLQAQIDDLQDQYTMGQGEFDDMVRRVSEAENKLRSRENGEGSGQVNGKEELQTSLKTLRDLIDEVKELRITTEGEIHTELQSLLQLRQLIIGDMTLGKVDSPPLKRKRDSEDDGESEAESEANSQDEIPYITSAPRASGGSCAIEFDTIQLDRPSPHKRARRFVSVAAQTATAVALGAAAAWSALAFS